MTAPNPGTTALNPGTITAVTEALLLEVNVTTATATTLHPMLMKGETGDAAESRPSIGAPPEGRTLSRVQGSCECTPNPPA